VGARYRVQGLPGQASHGGRRRPGAPGRRALAVCVLAAALLLGAATASARSAGGVHLTDPQTDKVITAYSFQGFSPAAVGTIDEANHTIALSVPFGTNVTALVATFTANPEAAVTVPPSDAIEESGVTPHDFTHPVVYKVQARDTTSVNYTVTVTVASPTPTPPPPSPSSAKQITAFSFEGLALPAVGVITEQPPESPIVVTVPYGTNVRALVATFTTSPGAKAFVNGIEQVSGVTANDFTPTVTYEVQAADGSSQLYRVAVMAGQPIVTPPAAVKWKGKSAILKGNTWAYNNGNKITKVKVLVKQVGPYTACRLTSSARGLAAVQHWSKRVTRWTNRAGLVKWSIKLPGKGHYSMRVSMGKTSWRPAYKTPWVKFTAKK
jgi:hypothetical protein